MNKLAFHYKPSGKPVLVLVHGFLGSKEQWNSMLPSLPHYDLLLVELPGHGDSPSCDCYTLYELAHEISKFLDQYKINKIHFVGHSMGGYLGCAFAKAYSNQLNSLILINSIAGGDSIARKQLRNRAIQLIDRHKETYVSMGIANLFTETERKVYQQEIELMKMRASKISLESVLAALRVMRDRPNNLEFFKNLDIPITYLYGENDKVIVKNTIENEVSQLGAIHESMPAGHMLLITHPDEICKKIKTLLK